MTDLPFLVLDLETTGLDPAQHEILEVGALTLDGQHAFEAVATRCDIDNVDAYVREMHTKNGLWRDVMQAGRPIADIDLALQHWLEERGARPQSVVLVGHSIHFDLGFIKVHMPHTAKLISHRVRDIGAIGRCLRDWGVQIPELAETPHRALADCRIELDGYKACERAVRGLIAGQVAVF